MRSQSPRIRPSVSRKEELGISTSDGKIFAAFTWVLSRIRIRGDADEAPGQGNRKEPAGERTSGATWNQKASEGGGQRSKPERRRGR